MHGYTYTFLYMQIISRPTILDGILRRFTCIYLSNNCFYMSNYVKDLRIQFTHVSRAYLNTQKYVTKSIIT